MQRALIPTIALVLFTMSSGAAEVAAQQADRSARTITASGSATVRVAPDAAWVEFTVETRDKFVAEARATNAVAIRKVSDAVAKLNLANLEVHTSDIAVDILYPRRDQENALVLKLPAPLGYEVSHSLIVTLRKRTIEQLNQDLGRVIDMALENGASSLDDHGYFKESVQEESRQAMTQAVADALANAHAYAAGAKLTITGVVGISGYSNSSDNIFGGVGGFIDPGAETSIQAGEFEVQREVTVECSY